MIVIVEGPDLAGKTTAIEQIAKSFNSGFILKNTYKPKTAKDDDKLFKQYWAIIDSLRNYFAHPDKEKTIVLLDRFYPSQVVYHYLRGGKLDKRRILELEYWCSDMHMILIYIDTPMNILEQRYENRGDDFIKIEQLREIKARYGSFLANTKLPYLKINPAQDKDWLKKTRRFIQNAIRKNNSRI